MDAVRSLCLLAALIGLAYGGCNTCTRAEAFQQQYTSSCGFMGWSRCNKYRTAYRQQSYQCQCVGDWGAWSSTIAWRSDCSTSCGNGVQTGYRTRTCTKQGGVGCTGSNTQEQKRTCKLRECPVNGQWSAFSAVTWNNDCSATCGFGVETGTKTRTCTNPAPAYGGKSCTGSSTASETRQCKLKECPINGGWTDFSSTTWSGQCSTTCGFGTETGSKTRTCTNPTPAFGGNDCQGQATSTESRQCKLKECPIDGGWTDFSSITWNGDCSAECGFGTETGYRTRTCTNPTPAFDGKECEDQATSTESRQCKLKECPIDGGWSEFSDITWNGDCSTTCDFGTETGYKTRTCTNPLPAFGGKSCEGFTTTQENRQCKLKECPIDGGWTEYGPFTEWSSCSVTCGVGTQTRSHERSCTNPEPEFEGKDCEGDATESESQSCDMKKCPDTICAAIGTGYEANLQQCQKYLSCLNGIATVMSCAEGLVWSQEHKACIYPEQGNTCLQGDAEDSVVLCQYNGQHLVDETDCHKFYQCVGLTPKEMTCQNGLAWNDVITNCDDSKNVPLCETTDPKKATEAPPTEAQGFSCGDKTGYFTDPVDCTKYYWCVAGQQYHMPCGAGTHFDGTRCVFGGC